MRSAMVIRSAALGDVISAEPIIRALSEKGYQSISFLTQERFRSVFDHHPLLETAKPVPVQPDTFSLDNSYEKDLDVLIQDSYCKVAGVLCTDKMPRLYVSDNEKHWGRRILDPQVQWALFDIGYPDGPCGRGFWGPDDWAPIVRRVRELGFRVVQVSNRSTSESPPVSGVDRDMRQQTSIRQLFALLTSCQLYIGMDGGTMHAAQALRVPGLSIFNPAHPASSLCPPGSSIRAVHRARLEHFGERAICDAIEETVQSCDSLEKR